jgi:hypothetical protein
MNFSEEKDSQEEKEMVLRKAAVEEKDVATEEEKGAAEEEETQEEAVEEEEETQEAAAEEEEETQEAAAEEEEETQEAAAEEEEEVQEAAAEEEEEVQEAAAEEEEEVQEEPALTTVTLKKRKMDFVEGGVVKVVKRSHVDCKRQTGDNVAVTDNDSSTDSDDEPTLLVTGKRKRSKAESAGRKKRDKNTASQTDSDDAEDERKLAPRRLTRPSTRPRHWEVALSGCKPGMYMCVCVSVCVCVYSYIPLRHCPGALLLLERKIAGSTVNCVFEVESEQKPHKRTRENLRKVSPKELKRIPNYGISPGDRLEVEGRVRLKNLRCDDPDRVSQFQDWQKMVEKWVPAEEWNQLISPMVSRNKESPQAPLVLNALREYKGIQITPRSQQDDRCVAAVDGTASTKPGYMLDNAVYVVWPEDEAYVPAAKEQMQKKDRKAVRFLRRLQPAFVVSLLEALVRERASHVVDDNGTRHSVECVLKAGVELLVSAVTCTADALIIFPLSLSPDKHPGKVQVRA